MVAEEGPATITVKVIKGDGVRLNYLGEKPAVLAQLRINVGGKGEQAYRTTPAAQSTSPEWNQQFVLPVKDPNVSQLECTLWDDSDPNAKNHGNFLGEVILNLAKLVAHKSTYIEQVFDIKQGKTIKTEKMASGKLKMGLQLDFPPAGGAAPVAQATTAPQPAAAAPPPPAPAPPAPAPVAAPAPAPPSPTKVISPSRVGALPGGGPADVGLILGQGPNNSCSVQTLIPGGPAATSGQIRAGDLLIDVDGHDVVGRGVPEVQNMLRGDRNSPVTMIFRRNAEQVVVTLLRAIPVQAGAPAQSQPAPAPTTVKAQTAATTPSHAAHVPPPAPGLPAEQLNALKREFASLSYLWGDNSRTDATLENMNQWKASVLYGPKRDLSDMSHHEVDDRASILSSSYRNMSRASYGSTLGPQTAGGPGPGGYVNPPMYRSFDQGSVNMYSSRNGLPYAVSNARIAGVPQGQYTPTAQAHYTAMPPVQAYTPTQPSSFGGARVSSASLDRGVIA